MEVKRWFAMLNSLLGMVTTIYSEVRFTGPVLYVLSCLLVVDRVLHICH